MRLTLEDVLAATGAVGDLGSNPVMELERVTIDSRDVRAGDLFVCLPGTRFDGHDFAAEAARRGARAILAERPIPDVDADTPVLVAPGSMDALTRLASHWRVHAGSKVLALSGSAGKTTLKDMLAGVLTELAPTAKTYKNYNNQLGLALSLLASPARARFWVMELGISRPGDMQELAAVARPDLAVVHNVGLAHAEGLGGVEGVAEAKASLFSFVKPGGLALANRDHPELWKRAKANFPDVIPFSTRGGPAPFLARYQGLDSVQGQARGRFLLELDGDKLDLALPVFGVHAAENVLAAAAAAKLMGARPEDIARGLGKTGAADGRFKVLALPGFTVIDDSYNANPLSMRASILAALEMAGTRPLFLVLGQMGELGAHAREAHVELGRTAGSVNPKAVFFQGPDFDAVVQGAREAGYSGPVTALEAPGDLPEHLSPFDHEGGVALVKGSRSQHMERHVTMLVKQFGGAQA